MKVNLQVKGINEVRAACKGTATAVQDLKRVHNRLGGEVIKWASPSMPDVTGKFRRGWKSGKLQGGVKVYNKEPHASMLEVGGTSFWRPKKGKYTAVPIGDGIRMMKRHVIWKKAKRGANDSYYVIPAVTRNHARLELLYGNEVERIFKEHL
jgi:hypothetical protein